MWQRYWRAFVWAIPVGAPIGIAIFLMFYLTGNPDFRNMGGLGALLHMLALGIATGSASALAALIGGILALIARDRHLEGSSSSRKTAAALGAAGGAAALWFSFGAIDGVTNGWSWFGLTVIVSAVVALVAAIAAWVLIGRAENKADVK